MISARHLPWAVVIMLIVMCIDSGGSVELEHSSAAPLSVLFVSDLHMGVGRDPAVSSHWHETEDFRWHREFSDFLDYHAALAPSIDLVLVGDILELWQPLKSRCHHENLGKDFGCLEEEALATTRRVLQQHESVFQSLSRFALAGHHRIVLLSGNHDAALLFPRVRDLVLQAFSESARAKVRFADMGYWVSADGRVYAEHGQQIGADLNRLEGWPDKILLENEGQRYLVKSWGEQFVQRFYNAYENEFPTIDNLSEEILGIQYVNLSSNFWGTAEDVGRALRFVLTQTSWEQTQQLLGKSSVPEWDMAATRASLNTPDSQWDFLISSYPADSMWGRTLAVITDLPPIEPALSDAEIISICERKWLAAQPENGADVKLCPSTGQLGAIFAGIQEQLVPDSKAETMRRHLAKIRQRLKAEGSKKPFDIFVFGHTHKVEQPYTPYPDESSWRPTVVNDGAWQRTATPADFCSAIKRRKLSEEEAIRELQPEDLPPCYPYAIVRNGAKTSVEVLYWVQRPQEKGRVLTSCPRRIHPDCLSRF